MSLFSGMSADTSADASADALCIIIQIATLPNKASKSHSDSTNLTQQTWSAKPDPENPT